MNDEIKEFNEEKYVEMLENGELYDYITNLQQENEMLKINKVVNIANYVKDMADYKSRVEKASSLIEPLVEWGECTINGKILKSVYDILNGEGSDE